ncbi:hypothetical protein E2320_012522, partial [Naja naja]
HILQKKKRKQKADFSSWEGKPEITWPSLQRGCRDAPRSLLEVISDLGFSKRKLLGTGHALFLPWSPSGWFFRGSGSPSFSSSTSCLRRPSCAALNSELLKVAGDGSQEPNPSLYLALRLSSQHNLEKEREYLNRLMDKPGTGELALYLLALRAACQDMDTPERKRMVTQLKLLLNKEMKQIVQFGHPGFVRSQEEDRSRSDPEAAVG